MALSLKDISLDRTTTQLLNMAGKQDRAAGVGRDAGWRIVAEQNGFDTSGRTPASEAYEDGWYAPVKKQ